MISGQKKCALFLINPDIEQDLDKPVHPPNSTPAFTTHQLTQVIKKLKTRKAPGADLVTTQMLKELPQEGLTYLRHIYNAITRISYWPRAFKHAQIIMLPKPGKDPKDISSYRPISLLPTISKVLEKLLITHITNDADLQPWIPHHQFGFRKAHSTIQQCYRITDAIHKAFDDHRYCSAVFLDISQAFDKVRHPGLLYKIKCLLPLRYFQILRSYLHSRTYNTKFNSATSSPHPI